MPLVPGPYNQQVFVVDYPPPLAAESVIDRSNNGNHVTPTVGVPRQYVEVIFGPATTGRWWLIDGVSIASDSHSQPTCFVGLTQDAQPSLWVPSVVQPFGDVNPRAVLDWTPRGWGDRTELGGVAISGGQRLSVLWRGVTNNDIAVNPPVLSCWAVLNYRVAVVVPL